MPEKRTEKKVQEHGSESAPMEHVEVAYPTMEQGMHAAQHLGRAALGGEDLARNDLIAHAWILAGAGLGQVFPADGPMMIRPIVIPDDMRQELAELASMKDAGKIDWGTYIKLALSLILKILVCLVLVLTFATVADAAPQAPTPPQDMLAAMSDTVRDPSVFSKENEVKHDHPEIPTGSILLGDGVHKIPGGCIWGPYDALYERSLRTGQTLVVHVGKRVEGLCHSGRQEQWLNTLQPEFMGHTSGVVVLMPKDGKLWAGHVPLPTVAAVHAYAAGLSQRLHSQGAMMQSSQGPMMMQSMSGYSGGGRMRMMMRGRSRGGCSS